MLVEQLVATSVVLLVGGAVIGIVLKSFLGGRKEDNALDAISKKYQSPSSDKSASGKDGSSKKKNA